MENTYIANAQQFTSSINFRHNKQHNNNHNNNHNQYNNNEDVSLHVALIQ